MLLHAPAVQGTATGLEMGAWGAAMGGVLADYAYTAETISPQ